MARAMSGSSTADGQSNKAFSATKNVLRLICLMHALTSIDRINVNTALFSRKTSISPTYQLRWVFSAFGWAYLCLQVSGGWLSDRSPLRELLTQSPFV